MATAHLSYITPERHPQPEEDNSPNKLGVFECPLCFEGLDNESRVPMLLECGHTLCVKCLTKLIGDAVKNELYSFPCPYCKKD
jgi:hypothetical protein